MKKQDKIKKALEWCISNNYCQGCLYYLSDCETLKSDALAYIQQLENHIRDLTKMVDQLNAERPKWKSIEEGPPDRKEKVLAEFRGCGERVWYICQRNGRGDVLVSDRDIKRFLRIGFHVESAYMNGKRYRNIYMLSGEIHFVK